MYFFFLLRTQNACVNCEKLWRLNARVTRTGNFYAEFFCDLSLTNEPVHKLQ